MQFLTHFKEFVDEMLADNSRNYKFKSKRGYINGKRYYWNAWCN